MKKNTVLVIVLAVVVAAAAFFIYGMARRGANQTAGSNVVRRDTAQQSGGDGEGGDAQIPQRPYDVVLEERSAEEQYTYDLRDLSLIDTESGEAITVGMEKEKIEAITGTATETHPTFTVYDGVVVQYTKENTAASLVVSSGQFRDDARASRYRTARGVGILTSFEDFEKAYGEKHREKTENGETKMPATAIRYFKVEGKKVTYLGDNQNDAMDVQTDENVYMQDFIFDSETNCITAMRIVRADYVGR